MKDLSKLNVAIVHDWLIGGGAERVVEELHHMFPDAPIYTSYCTDEWRQRLDNKVVTGFLQQWPFSKLRKYIPFLRIWWFSRLNLKGYNLVISSSGAEAKGIKTAKPTVHINYCHAPTHYYWSRYDEYLKRPGFGVFDPIARFGLKLLVGPLRRWDYKAAQRPDSLLANSSYIQQQIKQYYGRESTVIHPPVDIARFKASQNPPPRRGLVTTGRQTPYKRIDLAVAACSQLGLTLNVIGNGPDHARLVAMAGPTISFTTNASDEEVTSYLQSAEAFVFPTLDDFGISAVEALAAGTPVIAYKGGGALDYIVPGKTGIFFNEQTVDSLMEAIKSFKPEIFDSNVIRKTTEAFSQDEFRKNITLAINQSFGPAIH